MIVGLVPGKNIVIGTYQAQLPNYDWFLIMNGMANYKMYQLAEPDHDENWLDMQQESVHYRAVMLLK